MAAAQLETLNFQTGDKAKTELERAVSQIENLAQSVGAWKLFCSVVGNFGFAPEGTATVTCHGQVPAKVVTLAHHIYPFFGDCDNPERTPKHVNRCIENLNTLISIRQIFGFATEKEAGVEDDDRALSLRSLGCTQKSSGARLTLVSRQRSAISF